MLTKIKKLLGVSAILVLTHTSTAFGQAQALYTAAPQLTYKKVDEAKWPAFRGVFDGTKLSDVLAKVTLSEDQGGCEAASCARVSFVRNARAWEMGPDFGTNIVVAGLSSVTQEQTVTRIPDSCQLKNLYSVDIEYKVEKIKGRPDRVVPGSVTVNVISVNFGFVTDCRQHLVNQQNQ